MKRRIIQAAAALVVIASAGTPAMAAPPPDAPPESYLYVVDASFIKVVPKPGGKRAKIIVLNAKVTRFSDRPYRHEVRITVEEMLREFQWDSVTQEWGDPAPNAGVSVAGQRTEIVEIQRSSGDADRLVFHVRDVREILKRVSGPGAIFIDNVELEEP